jgi:hypothetical protein
MYSASSLCLYLYLLRWKQEYGFGVFSNVMQFMLSSISSDAIQTLMIRD